MDDNTSAALDAEAPVNPYSLLDAVNAAAQRSNALWLIFLGFMAYGLLTVASLTHRDLLLDAGIALPLLQSRIDLSRFFVLAPAAFVLVHLLIIAQFVLAARKALEFDTALRLLESTDLRSHPLRLELDSFFFVQAIAGPERSRVGQLGQDRWIVGDELGLDLSPHSVRRPGAPSSRPPLAAPPARAPPRRRPTT